MALAEFFRKALIPRENTRDTAKRRRTDTRYSPLAKVGLWTAGVVTVLVIVAIAVAFLIDEPLRRRMESNLNNVLAGYTVSIGRLDFHPIGMSLDLEDSTIVQDDNPDPPVAHIPNLSASVNWLALLHGRVVADFEIDSPKVYLNRKQAKKEVEDEVPVKERGWQEALEEIYPLKVNHFEVRNGELTYVDEGPFKPLQLTNVNFRAENIRNVKSEEGVYPSPVHIDAVVFGKGKAVVDGHADFLAEPHVSFKTDLSLDEIGLDYFKPILDRNNFVANRGNLSARGNMEYAEHTKFIDINEIRVKGLDANYINRAKEAAAKEASKKVDRVTKEHSDSPTLDVRIDKVYLNGKLGFVNEASDPQYKLFVEPANLQISNFTNQSQEGVMVATLTGKFMGSGPAQATINARPSKKGPDMDIKVAIDQTDMRTMNDLFRAYGKFDVVAGQFSFYSEISVRNSNIEGYVKPLFKDVGVYDRSQDREKGVFQQMYEGLIGGLSFLLKNPPRQEVATTVPISGKLSNPETSTGQAIVGLVQNAFFKAILPGFEREASAHRKR